MFSGRLLSGRGLFRCGCVWLCVRERVKGLFTSAWVRLSVSLGVGVRASASVVVSVAVSVTVAARVGVRDRVKS